MKFWILLLSCLSTNAVAESVINGFVIKVYDGDTATVVAEDQTIYKIRLSKIDAPELKQIFGKESKACLADKILNQKVMVHITTKDFYQRYLGEIFRNGISVNEQLIEEGCAWVYTHYTKDENLILLEKNARIQKKGLWSQKVLIAPWIWRNLPK